MSIISPTSFTSVNIANAQKAVITMVSGRPLTEVQNDPPVTPGEIIGYYNEAINKVELFVGSSGGTFWRRVG